MSTKERGAAVHQPLGESGPEKSGVVRRVAVETPSHFEGIEQAQAALQSELTRVFANKALTPEDLIRTVTLLPESDSLTQHDRWGALKVWSASRRSKESPDYDPRALAIYSIVTDTQRKRMSLEEWLKEKEASRITPDQVRKDGLTLEIAQERLTALVQMLTHPTKPKYFQDKSGEGFAQDIQDFVSHRLVREYPQVARACLTNALAHQVEVEQLETRGAIIRMLDALDQQQLKLAS